MSQFQVQENDWFGSRLVWGCYKRTINLWKKATFKKATSGQTAASGQKTTTSGQKISSGQKTTSASKKNSGNGNESRKSEEIDSDDLPDLEWLKTIGCGTFHYFENKLTKVWTYFYYFW